MNMRRSSQQGIALLEAMIATVILAIGLLGTIGLQARAYSVMNEAGARAEATIASERLLGMMSTDMTNLSSYVLTEGNPGTGKLKSWVDETKAAIPSARPSVTVTAGSNGTNSTQVTVIIKWQRKANDAVNVSTMTSYLSKSS